MKKQLRGSICLLFCTAIWGAAFVAQADGMDYIGPFAFQAIRCALAVIGLLPVIAIADLFKKDGKTFFSRWCDPALWKAALFCGIPLFLAVALQQMGISDNDEAGKSAFITAMYIVIVPIISLFLGKKPSFWVIISVLLAVAGLYLLCFTKAASLRFGDILLFGCAISFAVQIVFVDKLAQNVDSLRLNLLQALICSVLSALVMVFTEKPTLSNIIACAIPLAYTGFLSMGAAYSLQIIGQKDLPPAAASVIMSLECVFAMVLGNLYRHEQLSIPETMGCILMFAAVLLSQLPQKNKKSHRQKTPEQD